jgi:hypothetical protein
MIDLDLCEQCDLIDPSELNDPSDPSDLMILVTKLIEGSILVI